MQSPLTRCLSATMSLAIVLTSVHASAQGAAPEKPATTRSESVSSGELEEVLVRGQRMSEIEFDLPRYVRDFLEETVALPPGGGYARWHRSVCVGIHNLDAGPAQYLVDRISILAMDVGLEPGEPGCNPDVMIIFTIDAQEVAAHLVESQPRLFRPGGPVCCMQLGLDALDEFVESDKPVRWWHVSMPVDERLGQRAIPLPQDGPGNYPVIAVAGPSRIHNGTRDDLHHVIVIVDGTKLSGTTWEEIGDYLALVSLAQISPNADLTQFDSILNLFSNPAAYSGLTDWDRTYIRSLYSIDLARRHELQENEVVSEMVQIELESIEQDLARAEESDESNPD